MDKVVTDSSRTLEEKKGRSLERIRTQASMAFTVARYRNSALALLILRLESNEHDFNESFRALS